MSKGNFQINEFGEIVREDYFFRTVKGTATQVLPSNRKAWKIYLLSFVTFDIYGFVVSFAMAKETNISCAEDGKHTKGFWGTLFLSIITLFIYAIVWEYKWLNREANYLESRGKKNTFTGGSYLLLVLFLFILPFLTDFVGLPPLLGDILGIIFAIIILTMEIAQHNAVNETYNEENFPRQAKHDTEMNFYINMDNEVYGPFSLSELKNDYPILKDTLITTNTLNGDWYEAKYFECFDEIFDSQQSFQIGNGGTIIHKQ
ncbi:hypothetical protein SAMD00024442_63_9 [Candidatus Symbiothrix dinenymphae]|nr:hypothetical protein SAMD00024442_63_9 [Candidatus Symbiothrix dinenymphae]